MFTPNLTPPRKPCPRNRISVNEQEAFPMKAHVLSGGSGTRFYHITKLVDDFSRALILVGGESEGFQRGRRDVQSTLFRSFRSLAFAHSIGVLVEAYNCH